MKRRDFLVSGGAALLGTALYGRFIEPAWPVLSQHRIPFFQEPGQSLRILHLSDLHYSDVVPLSFIGKAIQMGLEQEPDLICLTGDYMTAPLLGFADYVEILKPLSARAPVYACLGNHDYYGPGKIPVPAEFKGKLAMPSLLAASGIHLLHNELRPLNLRGRSFQIAGLGDTWRRRCFPERAFSTQQDSLPTLLLSHNPDSKSLLQNYSWKLMLCGHSHGGQVKIPFYGAVYAPIDDFDYIEGLNAWEKRWIYTTRGVGNLHGIRLNCRPEVSILELV